MEQIDIELIVSGPHSRWEDYDAKDRQAALARLPYSVQVAADFEEIDAANLLLETTIGAKDVAWSELFYYKMGYDFGFAEYFFSVRFGVRP